MAITLLIKNGRVIDPANNIDKVLDVYIVDNKISQVAENITKEADKVINAEGMWVTPGFIDLHVHLRDPGFEEKETIVTGTMAGVMGGFTTLCCMPNTNPVVDNEFIVQYIKNKSKESGKCNVLPIGAITNGMEGEELSSIGNMVQAGICGISEDGKTVENAALMKMALKYVKMFDLPTFAHCEDKKLAGAGQINAGDKANELGLKGISNDSEDVIVARDIILAESVDAKLHLCHMSTELSVELLKQSKARGSKVTGEVTPHHFTLCDEDITGYNTDYKMSPPLRNKKSVNAVIKGLQDGTIDVIATDHAPHTYDDKNCEFSKASNGIVGLETALGLSITELVDKNILSPTQLISKLTCNPARILGIEKGCLTEGYEADITIINPTERWIIDKAKFLSKGKNTPFHGREVSGKVKYTIVSGNVVVENGKLI